MQAPPPLDQILMLRLHLITAMPTKTPGRHFQRVHELIIPCDIFYALALYLRSFFPIPIDKVLKKSALVTFLRYSSWKILGRDVG